MAVRTRAGLRHAGDMQVRIEGEGPVAPPNVNPLIASDLGRDEWTR